MILKAWGHAVAFGLGHDLSWDVLAGKSRVVLLAETGNGKTEGGLRAITMRLKADKKATFWG
jgi:hypothetical protein